MNALISDSVSSPIVSPIRPLAVAVDGQRPAAAGTGRACQVARKRQPYASAAGGRRSEAAARAMGRVERRLARGASWKRHCRQRGWRIVRGRRDRSLLWLGQQL